MLPRLICRKPLKLLLRRWYINYLIQIRLNHAKELLKNDSLSVKEVAKRLVTKMPIILVNYSKILWKIPFTILR